MGQQTPLPKVLAVLVVIGIMGATLWMHWQSIQEKLMPDYGTDPYVLGAQNTCAGKSEDKSLPKL